MAEGRMLKKKIARDGRVAQLSPHSALLYVLSIPHLDIEGRMDGNPVAVRGAVVPALALAHPDDWTDRLVESYVVEWTGTRDEASGLPRALVAHYFAAGLCVCHFAGFKVNQKLNRGRERPSSFPPPPPMLLERLGIAPDADSGSTPELLRTQAEAEPQVQEPPDQRGPSRAREADRAALLDQIILEEEPKTTFVDGVVEGVRIRQHGLSTHGALGPLLAVLPDADKNTPVVLHAHFDPLGPDAIAHAVREISDLGESVRRPSAYAIGIAKRLAAKR